MRRLFAAFRRRPRGVSVPPSARRFAPAVAALCLGLSLGVADGALSAGATDSAYAQPHATAGAEAPSAGTGISGSLSAGTGTPGPVFAQAEISGAGAASAGTSAPQAERRELWTGSLYTSTYRIGMCVKPSGAARGVVLLRIYNGDVDVYHVKGTVRDGRILATHHSGHSFRGQYDSPDVASGVITLKSGREISLKAKRTLDARLDDDCRPLPED